MAENYFGDDDDAKGPAPDSQQDPDNDAAKNKEDGDKPMALINAEIAPDLKPGDELRLKVVAVHEGEYQVEKMDDEEHEEKESPDEPEGGMQAPEGSMAAMMG